MLLCHRKLRGRNDLDRWWGSARARNSQELLELPRALVAAAVRSPATERGCGLGKPAARPAAPAWWTCLSSMFSHVLCPIFVPLAVIMIEAARWHRMVLIGLVTLGLLVGL